MDGVTIKQDKFKMYEWQEVPQEYHIFISLEPQVFKSLGSNSSSYTSTKTVH